MKGKQKEGVIKRERMRYKKGHWVWDGRKQEEMRGKCC